MARCHVEPPSTDTSTPPTTPPPPENGRIDALTITAGAIAGVGLIAGGALGIYALTQRPSDFVTGRDGSYSDLQDQTDSAHTTAIVADVALVIGVVAGIAAGWLYFGRPKETGSGTGVKVTPTKSASGSGGGLRFTF